MVVIRQSGSIWAKLLYSGKCGCFRAKMVVFVQKWLYSFKKVVFGQSGIIRKVVVFEQKWLYSNKVNVFGQIGCIRAMGLHWGKVVVIGKKWLYSRKVVVFGQGGCNRVKWL